MKNKKATLDNIFAVVSIFGFVLVLLVAYIFWTNITTTKMDSRIWNDNTYTTQIKANGQRAIDRYDTIFLLAYFGVHLGILVLAFMLRSHPVVLIAIFFVSLLIAIVSAQLSNVYQNISVTDTFATAVAAMPKMNSIMINFPKFEIAWTLITGIVLVGLSRSEQ